MVAVDELLKLTGDDIISDKGKQACQNVLSNFYSLFSNPRVVFVLTSLSFTVLTSSGRQIIYFDIPVLSSSEVKLIVIVDGVTNDHRAYLKQIFNPRFAKRRVAIAVASVAMKTNSNDDRTFSCVSIDCYPCDLVEYLTAVEDQQFRESISPFMVEKKDAQDLPQNEAAFYETF